MKAYIMDTITDMISDFLYYDRKEDEELPLGAIEKALCDGDITIDEIVEKFRQELTDDINTD